MGGTDAGLLRFDSRVAIVTGAGSNPGLGRSYARLLAQRGAKVVVNDISPAQDGSDLTPAQAVAAEIVAQGGEAIADHSDISTEQGAKDLVAHAMREWGRVDILVNNAGINVPSPFGELTSGDLRAMVDVHLMGHLWMCRAVWPIMVEAQYGRIVNTSSGVMLGRAQQVVYGALKGAIFSLTLGLSAEAWAHGIRVNTIAPSAGTAGARVLAEDDDPWMRDVFIPNYSPDIVAPVVAYLAHENCDLNGRWFASAAGRVSEGIFLRTPGIADPDLSIETVRDQMAQIGDVTGAVRAPDPHTEDQASGFVPRRYVPRVPD